MNLEILSNVYFAIHFSLDRRQIRLLNFIIYQSPLVYCLGDNCITWYDVLLIGLVYFASSSLIILSAYHNLHILLSWQVEFRMVVFRPFVGEIIAAKLKESNKDGLRCMFNEDFTCIFPFCLVLWYYHHFQHDGITVVQIDQTGYVALVDWD